MQIAFHIGAHCTDEDRLLKSLLKNRGVLAKQGIVVPGPSRYRTPIRELMNALTGKPADSETQDALLDAIIEEDVADRMVLSNQNFICVPPRAVGDGVLYPRGQYKLKWMQQLFPDHEVEFYMAIRDPATFLPAVFATLKNADYDAFLASIDPLTLRWSETIGRFVEFNPTARITIWCNEDTPLLWTEIMREVAGADPLTPLDGGFDVLATIISETGLSRLTGYLDKHPPQNEVQLRRILAAFLDKFGLEEEIEVELDPPGWDDGLVAEMTAAYEEDLYAIERLPGVTVIAP